MAIRKNIIFLSIVYKNSQLRTKIPTMQNILFKCTSSFFNHVGSLTKSYTKYALYK